MEAPKTSYPKTRLFVEAALQPNASVTIEDEQAHYLLRVMRIGEGERLALFNGRDGEWAARVTATAKKSLELVVQESLRPYLPPPDVWLCFAPIKFGRIDYLVQKATELGAAVLQPVLTQYTQAERINDKRLLANAIEAAEQCERVEVPTLKPAVKLPQLLADWPADRVLFFADESGSGGSPQDVLRQVKPEKWGLLIGPEGGFSPDERALIARVKAAQAISLGPRILRADTAAISLLALTQCFFGDWHIAPRYQTPYIGPSTGSPEGD